MMAESRPLPIVGLSNLMSALRYCCAVLSAMVALIAAQSARAETYQWTTIAGNTGGFGATDGPVAMAHFAFPAGIASDAAGNLYIADGSSSTIRKITPGGIVSTLAGIAYAEGSANGAGNIARFNRCSGVAVDGSGNVYVADTNNHTIRKITPAGVVSTLAGSPEQSGSTNGTGSAARFNRPIDLAVDAGGNVYVADDENKVIRKVTPAGVVTTLAGSPGIEGTADGTGSAARFRGPSGITVDSAGNLYVSDSFNYTIRKVTPVGVVTTIAGSPGAYGSTDGTGSAARFGYPRGLKLDGSGNLYVADYNTELIRRITPAGVVTTLAGSAENNGFVNGTGSAARFDGPTNVALDSAGNVYVTDAANHAIRKVTPARVVTTLSGGPAVSGSANGTGSAARFTSPGGAAVDAAGNLYISDTGNYTIRKITPAAVVTTLAGSPGQRGFVNGTGSAARFAEPRGLAVDSSGNVYVADQGSHSIRKITPAGVVTTLAGNGNSGREDGTGSAASFYSPVGVAVDRSGTVYVADTTNRTIRKITPGGVVTTWAGTAGQTGQANGTGSAARFSRAMGIAVDAAGNAYVADTGNYLIRKITPAAVVTTLAGNPSAGQGSEDGVGSAARFSEPDSIAVDALGNLYVTDNANALIRKITPARRVTTIGGLWASRLTGDGIGSAARFADPSGIACTPDGVVYVADTDNHRIVRGTIIPPVPNAQTAAAVEDTPQVITLTGSDVDGDPLIFIIVTPPEHGGLTGSGPARTYTPATDYNGPDSFTFKANDGTVDSAPATVSLNIAAVNDAPVFTAALPDIDAGPAAPDASYDLRALMRDPDVGDSHTWRITNVSNSAIFASLEVTGGLLGLRYAPYLSGTSTVEVEVADAAGETARMTVNVTLPVLPAPQVTASEALKLNRQTGLWEHRITLTNNAQRAIGGIEVAVGGLPADASLYNASDSLGANPLAGYYVPVAAGATVTMVLEYYSRSRSSALQPVLTTSVALPRNPPPGAPGGLAVDRVLPLPGPALLIEFTAVPGRRYSVQYSSSGTEWLDSPIPIRAAGNRVQWIDQGLPRTSTPPPAERGRFYRIREIAEAP
jgi:sugar lactone lactonase YvrE